ncbi:MAG: hypothetical protein GEU98_02495 [Pseudonocardiaceae bacterium]|nr:hypothetical protein [Pseudonocardiaceae bacterium]
MFDRAAHQLVEQLGVFSSAANPFVVSAAVHIVGVVLVGDGGGQDERAWVASRAGETGDLAVEDREIL